MIEKKRLSWFILLRVVVVSLFLGSTIILNAKEPEMVGAATISGLVKLIIATYLFSIVSLVALSISEKLQRLLTYAQIIWDLLLVTLLVVLTGGINSSYPILYMLSITNASVLLARREAIYTASLCSILYGAILDFQFYGKLTSLGLQQFPAQMYGANYILYIIFVNIMSFYLTAFLTGYLAERLRRSERALLKKAIDYEELERLNSSIVSNLDSGLLTITNEGRIRVFNPYMTDITGITQIGAYNRPLTQIISGFAPFSEEILSSGRGEFTYESESDSRKILEFKSVPFTDAGGNRIGVIIDIQDHTELKRMEMELKKADRLAAIGELSARIAHEIRNPLASISGSVQLIAQGERIEAADKKLLAIILRDTERLNKLVSDFLAYARPQQPVRSRVLLGQLITDLTCFLKADPLFGRVTIVSNCPENFVVYADRDQILQVLWNLFHNAAEAIPSAGEIRIEAVAIQDPAELSGQGEIVTITIADNGTGMKEQEIKNLFEPFFTTKPGGTGLGLATVYRIIQSHGGKISVESSPMGTIFTIHLPLI